MVGIVLEGRYKKYSQGDLLEEWDVHSLRYLTNFLHVHVAFEDMAASEELLFLNLRLTDASALCLLALGRWHSLGWFFMGDRATAAQVQGNTVGILGESFA